MFKVGGSILAVEAVEVGASHRRYLFHLLNVALHLVDFLPQHFLKLLHAKADRLEVLKDAAAEEGHCIGVLVHEMCT